MGRRGATGAWHARYDGRCPEGALAARCQCGRAGGLCQHAGGILRVGMSEGSLRARALSLPPPKRGRSASAEGAIREGVNFATPLIQSVLLATPSPRLRLAGGWSRAEA